MLSFFSFLVLINLDLLIVVRFLELTISQIEFPSSPLLRFHRLCPLASNYVMMFSRLMSAHTNGDALYSGPRKRRGVHPGAIASCTRWGATEGTRYEGSRWTDTGVPGRFCPTTCLVSTRSCVVSVCPSVPSFPGFPSVGHIVFYFIFYS